MERRELYEPEDIEQLLFERPYDALLEEERAFVLRHLSGRDEYEAMRALLLRVHEDTGTTAASDADARVREDVLAAFRAEQRPQWRIWLNSLGGALWPKEASAMWRPALALASIAALVSVGLIGYRSWNHELVHAPLAEVKEVKKAEDTKNDKPAPGSSEIKNIEQPTTSRSSDAPSPAPVPSVMTMTDAVPAEAADDAEKSLAEKRPVEDLDRTGEVVRTEAGATTTEGIFHATTVVADSDRFVGGELKDVAAAPASGLVNGYDMARNASTANTDAVVVIEAQKKGKAVSKEEKARRKGNFAFKTEEDAQATTDVTALVGLLRAAW